MQKAHVQQFLATEDALNKAAEARKMSQQLLKRLQGTDDAISTHSLAIGGTSKSMSSLKQLEVWLFSYKSKKYCLDYGPVVKWDGYTFLDFFGEHLEVMPEKLLVAL